jgi:large subunit ribosomal protein L13
MKTTYPKVNEQVVRHVLYDAEDQVLGRLAVRIANSLRGKDKPTYEPSVDTGDYVIVINASKVKLTGNKLRDKMRITHTQYPGGLKQIAIGDMMKTRPEQVIREAVEGMLPKNYLQAKFMRKLKIYKDDKHPHESQKPILMNKASR